MVEGRRFHHILEEFGVPYYLKIDIEGADLLCIRALTQVSERPKYVSLESNKTSWDELLNEFALLRGLGYRRFKVVNQLEVPTQELPLEALEGNYADYAFPLGSSGAFGDEAPGDWLSEQQAIWLYRRIFLAYRLFGDHGVFRRISWKRPVLWRLASLQRFIPPNAWYDTHASL
jgi:hypothetical protein